MNNINIDWQKEIEDLHDFFELWLAGKIDKTEKIYSQFSDAVDNNFSLVSPDGVLSLKKQLLPSLYQAHNKRKGVEIWTKNKKLLFQDSKTLLVSYEEWQKESSKEKVRLSTAIFIIDKAKANGVRWLRVHETWLAQ